MFKKFVVTFFGVLLVAGALAGTKVAQFRAMADSAAGMVPPAEVVTAAAVVKDEWENTLTSIGTLVPVQGITVTAETPGKINRITFESGTAVQAGQVLVQLETVTEEAQLHAAEAAAALAKVNLQRNLELRRQATVSQAELDAAEARYEEAVAQVEAISAAIAKKTILAPFSGRLGMRRVDLGEVLREGDAVTSLQSLDPIRVNFGLPQQRLSVLALGTQVRLTTDAAPGDTFTGDITAISPEVDPATRNVRLQATVSNREEKLRGGMFVNVEVVLPSRQQVLAIPLTAVLFAPFGDSVFVIEQGEAKADATPPKVLRQRFVRLGAERGDYVAVTDGLAVGEQVVTAGVFKLRSGMNVVIDNTLAPNPKLAPTPGDS